MRNTAAHRGILTTSPSRLCEEAQLDEFFARQRSRIEHNTNRRLGHYRAKLQRLAIHEDRVQLETKGGPQGTRTGAGYYGVRVGDED